MSTTHGEIEYADENGEFDLLDGTPGQPGCSDCGTESAVVRVGGRHGDYLCASAAAERGIEVPASVIDAVRAWDEANPDEDEDEDSSDELTDVDYTVTITLGANDSLPTESQLERAIVTALNRDSEISTVDGVKVRRQ